MSPSRRRRRNSQTTAPTQHQTVHRAATSLLRANPGKPRCRPAACPPSSRFAAVRPPRPPAPRSRLPTRVPPPPLSPAGGGGGAEYIAMAARILANLLITGGAVVGRVMVQAYRQALVNANKTGAAQEAINGIRRASKVMTEQEARQILGISEKTTWEEIVQKYDTMFERNAKNGSFYLQSKVHRAKECLEPLYQKADVPN